MASTTTNSSNYTTVLSPEHLQQLLSLDLTRVSVLYFRADWAEPCTQMDKVTIELANKWLNVLFLSIEAEALPDISESFEVDAVPYFILLRGHTLLTRLSGAQPSVLSAALTSHASSKTAASTSTAQVQKPPPGTYNPTNSGQHDVDHDHDDDDDEEDEGDEESDQVVEARCQQLMKQSDVVLFMKGDRNTPRCGFSQKMIGILGKQPGLEYTTFDILSDEAVRQKLKQINDWPTFPQLLVHGEFVGGLDIVQEMADSGELVDVLRGE